MKFEDLFRMSCLLVCTSLMSGCGSSGSNNPSNLFNGAVFIADHDTSGANELFIANSDGSTVTKISDAVVPVGNVQSFEVSPNIGFIAYLADQDTAGFNELYYVKKTSDTAGVVGVEASVKMTPEISSAAQSVTEYQWSPNGLLMAYLADHEGLGMNQLYISDAKTVIKVSPVAPTGDVTEIKWSPDSKNIAFKSPVGSANELHVSKADGSVIAKQVSASSATGPTSYEWSPDSSLIAYLSDEAVNPGVVDLYTTAVDALASTKVTDVTTGVVQSFRWPNSNSAVLAYSAALLAGGDVDLFIITLATSVAVQLSDVTLGGGVGVTNDFLWAPDNTMLAYVADQDATEFELYTTLLDGVVKGTKVSTAIIGGSAGVDITDGFIWGLSSNQLIYRADQDAAGVFELFTSTTDGVVATQGQKISGVLVANGNVTDFKLSPFGNAVSYIADQVSDEVFELYVTNLTDNLSVDKISTNLDPTIDVFQHDWTSDGTKVFYIADRTSDSSIDVYTSTSSATSLNLSNNSSATGSVIGALVDGSGVTDNLTSP